MENYERHESLGGLINVVAYRMRSDFERCLRQRGLDLSVWPVLVCLWESDGVPQARIGELLKVPGYAMSRGIDRLEAAGLVTRRFDPGNRRVRRVYLTPAGRAIQSELVPVAHAANAKVLGLLAEDEQRQLLVLLQKIVAGL